MISDFKAFILKGNVMDLAVGVIIGAAFGKIVDSLVGDIIMPIVGKLMGGGVDFSNMFVALDDKTYATLAEAKKAGGAVLAYGNFVTILLNFLILAFVIFMMVKQVQKMMPPPAAPAPAGPSNEEILLTQIRDSLKR